LRGEGQVECQFALLCEEAQKRDDNLVDVIGGGCDRLTTASLPASDTATLVFKLEFDAAEAEMMNTSTIAFVDPHGKVLSTLDGRFLPDWGGAVTATEIVSYPFTVHEPGRHHFALVVAEKSVAKMPLDVVAETG
jgi:hypothetical protein